MSKFIKKTVKLADGEALVVASIDFWQDMIALYQVTGDECDDKQVKDEWYAIANHIENWVDLTLNDESGRKYDESKLD